MVSGLQKADSQERDKTGTAAFIGLCPRQNNDQTPVQNKDWEKAKSEESAAVH